MTLLELAGKVGTTGIAQLGGLSVEVRILDAKISYGKPRFQITPVAGAGKVWVETVTPIPGAK